MLTGDLSHFGAAEVLGLVGRSGRHGALVVEGEGTAIVYCDGGDVTFATTRAGSTLADVLVTTRFLDADEWAEAAVTDDPATAVGKALATRGADPTRLGQTIQSRIEEALFETAMWRSGTFRFEPGADHVLGSSFRFSVAELLTAVDRRRQKWDDVVARFGSIDHVVFPAASPDDRDEDDALLLSRTQVRVLTAAARQVSVRTLAEELDLGLYGACEVIAGLVDRGLLAAGEAAPAAVVANGWDGAASSPAGGITFSHHAVTPIEDPVAVGAVNGYGTNGHGTNGYGTNGYASNGHSNGYDHGNGHATNGHDVDVHTGYAADETHVPVAPNGAEFVAPGDAPARDLILRLLTAVKEL